MTTSPLTVVPPRRLGLLLERAREAAGRSRDDVAASSSYSLAELTAIEAGDRVPTEDELTDLLRVYGVGPTELVPERSGLVIDLDEQRLVVGGEARTLAGSAPTADEVLATYLSLVYTLRHTEPGTSLTLRDADVDVLSRALELAAPVVEQRLHGLMAEPAGEVHRRVGLLRHRLLLPAIGVAVAATAVGVIVFVQTHSDDKPAATPTTLETPASDPGPATAEVPVQVDTIPGGPGAPQVATRNADGSINQTDRQPDPNAPAPPLSTTTTAP